MEKKTKKKWYKKWWIWVIIVLIIGIIGSESQTTPTATVTYEQKEINKGDPTGYTKTLGNGDFVVGEDIDAGMYNISGLGWVDSVTMKNPFDMPTHGEDGKVANVSLKDGQEISILDQENGGSMGVSNNTVPSGEDIVFTQIEPESQKGGNVTEKIEYVSDKKVCYINDEEKDCNELNKYDELSKEIDKQITNM